MSFIVKPTFVGHFKNGDNIAYNLKILGLLYEQYNQEVSWQRKSLLRKPIIIFNVSVTEALLDDLFFRVRYFFNEGSLGLSDNAYKNIKEEMFKLKPKDFNKFEKYIKLVRENNIFTQDDSFYENLDKLRKLRNRIHIQNHNKFAEPNDIAAFSGKRLVISEKVCEIIITKLEKEHGRQHDYVEDFIIPWDRHFS